VSQSAFIAAVLAAGFVLYLAAHDRLIVYAGALMGRPASGGATGGGLG
jgi:hypothetical protein